MKVTIHQPLWEKIQNFRIDNPKAFNRFSHKLASQNKWTPSYTFRVIEEYRRFMFLCCISPQGASPSYQVDQAWHLHLTYTQNYWKEFCRDTLGKDIHHHPSNGGNEEDHKHEDWYVETLKLYEKTFDEKPPPDIWPPPGKVLLTTPSFKPAIPSRLIWQIAALLLVPAISPLFFGRPSPFHLDGQYFLLYYFSLLIIGSFISIDLIRKQQEKNVEGLIEEWLVPKADAFQLSYYLSSRGCAFQTAIVDLVQRTILGPQEPGRLLLNRGGYVYDDSETNPIIRQLLLQYKDGDALTYAQVIDCYENTVVYHPELEKIVRVTRRTPFWIYFVPLFVFAVAIARVIQGVANGYPVGILLLCIVILAIAYYKQYQALQYDRIIYRLSHKGFRNPFFDPLYDVSILSNQVAVFGMGALSAGMLYTILERNSQTPGHNYYGSGTSCGGSTGGCSGSDGSGCGGGGCGGCGGGD